MRVTVEKMDTLSGASSGGPLPHSIMYPATAKSAKEKKTYKHSFLRQNPETLWSDFSQTGGRPTTTNLLLYTEDRDSWHKAICKHFQYYKKLGICNGRQIQIHKEGDNDNTFLTVNLYQNGTVMFQGSEASLISVQRDFDILKRLTKSEKGEQSTDPQSEAHSINNNCSAVPDEDELCTSHCDAHLEQSVCELRNNLALQEVILVELKEQLHLQTTSNQHLEAQFHRLKQEFTAWVKELRGQITELQEDKEALRRQLREVREEQFLREEALVNPREEANSPTLLHHNTTTPTTPVNTGTHTHTQESNTHATTHPPTPTTPATTHTLTPSTPATTDTASPSTSAEREFPPRSPPSSSTTDPPKPLPPSQRGTATNRATEVVILIDSNGKFINEQKLFPGIKATKIWCPKTNDALLKLNSQLIGEPSHIIIHVGTNDLWTLKERVADSVIRVAGKATETFPVSKIVISTILPRADLHPDTIAKVNAAISRGCALMPNVYLAHHPTLGLHNLHDHVHLRKDIVNVFAKTLKDVALDRSLSKRTTMASQTTKPYHPGHHPIDRHMPRLQYTPQHGPRHEHPKLQHPPPRQPPWHQRYPAPPHQHHRSYRHHQVQQEALHLPTSDQQDSHSRPPAAWQSALKAPQSKPQQQGQPSYAAVLSETRSTSDNKLEEIRDLLGIICTRLMN